ILDLLRVQSERQPLILVCEDIHWMDHTSSQLLDVIRQSIQKWPILVIVTFRPDFRLTSKADTKIDLNRLLPAQVASMIESLDYESELPTAVVGQIISKTDGVPLFVEEMTKTVLGDAFGNKPDVSNRSPLTLAVPETLHDSLMARLDQVPSTKAI